MKSALKSQTSKLVKVLLMFLSFTFTCEVMAECSACYYGGYQVGYAGACSECAAVFEQLTNLITTSTEEIQQNINQSTNSINNNIDGTRETLSKKIDTATNAIVAVIEKQSAAEQQLTQADLNYKAATISSRVGADAMDMFTQPAADLMNPNDSANACATMATAAAATTAASNAALHARSLAAASTRKALYTTNSSADLRKEVQIYAENFCSDKAFERGACSKKADADMQDADSNAGSLLAPVAGRTYSVTEAKAASQYVSNVIGPIQQESLPIVMEKTPAGQRFLVEQRSMASVQSMAAFSLHQIFSNNSAEDNSPGAAAGDKISLVGLMKKFVDDRFGSPTYRSSTATLNEVGLLRQIAENMAFQNWMDYYSYLQGERTEGLLATTLALSARERTERALVAARYQATSAK